MRTVFAVVICALAPAVWTSVAIADHCGQGPYTPPGLPAKIVLTTLGGGAAVAGGVIVANIEGHQPNWGFCVRFGPFGAGCDPADTSPSTDGQGRGQWVGRAPTTPGTHQAGSFYGTIGPLAVAPVVVYAEGTPGVEPVDHHEDAAFDALFHCPAPIVMRLGPDDCRFDICDWSEYPDGIWGRSVPDGAPMRLPRPRGPFRLRPGTNKQVGTEQYNKRQDANRVNRQLHTQYPSRSGDYHEWWPVKLGGDPLDYYNKILLATEDHQRVHRFWERVRLQAERLLAAPGQCPQGTGGVEGGVGG